MTITVNVGPKTVQKALDGTVAGHVVVLGRGRYRVPLRMTGRRGTKLEPIVVRGEGDVLLDGGQRLEDFNPRAQEVARALGEDGKFPGVYPIAAEGFLVLEGCEHVVIRSVGIEGAWPTAIALLDCRNILIDDVRIREGTFAIYAEGRLTRDITVQHCQWVQDVTQGELWRHAGWQRVHNDHVRPGDARALDGDFFRSKAIEGGVTIRHNVISHAFNGVHMYNKSRERPVSTVNNDVRIYGNTFNYVRDNAIEPEWGAFRWWVFHNRFFNCHKWLSLEMRRSGHFYVFGNVGWFDSMPGPIADDQYGGAVFKMQPKLGPGTGGHYVFHNSWYLRSSYVKKKRLARLCHFNNAIRYAQPGDHGALESEPMVRAPKPFFGRRPPRRPGPGDDVYKLEKSQFTLDWEDLEIAFFNDVVEHADYPEQLVKWGYDIKGGIAGRPEFRNPLAGRFELSGDGPCRGAAAAHVVILPDRSRWKIPAGGDVGAFQNGTLFPAHRQAYPGD